MLVSKNYRNSIKMLIVSEYKIMYRHLQNAITLKRLTKIGHLNDPRVIIFRISYPQNMWFIVFSIEIKANISTIYMI